MTEDMNNTTDKNKSIEFKVNISMFESYKAETEARIIESQA
jgi:hypothetical protein